MKLKKLAYLLVAALSFAGCQSEEVDYGEPAIEIDAHEITFPEEGGSLTLTLNSSREWKVKNSADWVLVTPEREKPSFDPVTVTVKVPANPGANRKAEITFFGGIVSDYLSIIQTGPEGETDGVESITVTEMIARADEDTYYRLTGTVTGFNSNYCSFDIADDSGSIYVYSVTQESKDKYASVIKNGGTVTLKGKYLFYSTKNQHEVVNAEIESFIPGDAVRPSNIVDVTVADFNAASVSNTWYRLTGTVTGSINKNYGNFTVKDKTGSVYVYGTDNFSDFAEKFASGGSVTVVGQRADYGGSPECLNGYIESYEALEGQTEITAVTVQELISKADDVNYYRLTGTVSGFNSEYCSFDLTDATGKIYVYSVTAASKERYSSVIQNDGTVTLKGKYLYYDVKNRHEIVEAEIEEYRGKESQDPPAAKKVTVDEFIKAADKDNPYVLTGTVSGFNANFCSFDLKDDTGSIYVYNVTNATKNKYSSIIKNGGTVTLTGYYDFYDTKSQHEVIKAEITSYESPMSTGTKVYYQRVSAITSGMEYILVAESKAAQNLASNKEYGYLSVDDVTDNNGVIAMGSDDHGFIITSTSGGYTIKGKDGRYLYQTGTYNSYNASAGLQDGCYWKVEFQSDGRAKITNTGVNKYVQYSIQYGSYGSYPDAQGVMPYLYERLDSYGGDTPGGDTPGGDTPGGDTPGGDTPGGDTPSGPTKGIYSSNVSWTLVSKSYDEKVVVSGVEYPCLKLGSSSATGEATITVPSGSATLSFYAMAWNGKKGTVEFYNGSSLISSFAPTSNSGIANSSPYTPANFGDASYFELSIPSGCTSITVKTISGATRVVLFGINAR